MVTISETSLPDVFVLVPRVFGDERGFFFETYRQNIFEERGWAERFVQDNQSFSQQGVLRGLHYQVQQAQGKLVRVLSGEVFDVAVDIRQSSPNFGQYVGVRLSSNNRKALWLPPGFAHGFYTLSEKAELHYKCTDYYAPQHERTIVWNDPTINIRWPLVDEQTPILSEKDAAGSVFKSADVYD